MTAYPETTSIRLPRGWRVRMAEAAAADGRSLGDWLRPLIRRALAQHERRSA